ncbi:MAG: 3-hydroxyacyl-CoA dehydrogenase [Bacteroidetes bacterium RIFCSPLOWO2_02_FULL_36_8]|nr:MAG: 3-hydroxyacyl-CoA dehydrogenase [Bacteroidetes bacterium RIFCSPLOWO2_02_FULL_36_8]OFY69162.1 MAG: 3-hydroxyacyl-CoA dehydrogenase [Bacteroidetes bacterium RIFCSPLOWO2_12_FULL_37_12]
MFSIKKVAVLGSGIMGSRIACHFANAGLEVFLLDICPAELLENEKKAGLTLEHPTVKNRIVNQSLKTAINSNPSPLYKKSFASHIHTGNFTDNLNEIESVDWILEAVVENLEIKNKIFTEVEKYRKPGTIITSNTSGIPIRLMSQNRSEDFQRHFCGTHFFNPPRYLPLLEIIPGPNTDSKLIEFLMHYGDLFLGKTTVLCKDTPAFIANRIGIFAIMDIFHTMQSMGLTVDETDALTGSVVGRPKSATCRTTDVVGLDTMVKVAVFLHEGLKQDESKEIFKLPEFVAKLNDNRWWGDKTRQGFYKKVKTEMGSEILTLNLQTFEYSQKSKVKFASLDATKALENTAQKIKLLYNSKDKAGEFIRGTFNRLFVYATNRIPEISGELYKIDLAVKAGFGWEFGPFETWDLLGIENVLNSMETQGLKPAGWITEMLNTGCKRFYEVEKGRKKYYDIVSKSNQFIPGSENFILLDNYRKSNIVDSNSDASLFDIGDGVLCLEFHTKMNAIGGGITEMLHRSIDRAEKDGWKGLVIGNQAPNFSAGANLALLLMYAIEQEYDEIDMMIRLFQKTTMRLRYSDIPVIVAPHGLTLGGGCEVSLHADGLQAAAETYIGLVEFGVGLIPGGGGTKEMCLRASDAIHEGDIELNPLKNNFLMIGMAKVATSAHEAFDMGIMRRGDRISMNNKRQLADAKLFALDLYNAGYSRPQIRKDIHVLGRGGLGAFLAGAYGMFAGHYISEHDKKISTKLAWIMCGGDLSAPTKVSEQYLLDLEREAFLSLCGERKTLERIQHTLATGKPLRN